MRKKVKKEDLPAPGVITSWQWFHAAETGDLATLQKALDQGFDIEKPSFGGPGRYSAVVTAVRYSQFDTLRFLLAHGASPNVLVDGQSVLEWACGLGWLEAVKILVEEGKADIECSRPDYTGVSPLFKAFHDEQWETAFYLLEHGAKLSPRNLWVIEVPEILLQLAEKAYAAPMLPQILVYAAASAGYYEKTFDVLQILVKKRGIIPAETTPNLIAKACESTLLHKRKEWFASSFDKCMTFLHEQGVNVNEADEHGMTPFLLAADNCRRSALKTLKKLGADTSVVDKEGRSALHYAAMRGELDKVQYLVENCLLEVNAQDHFGRTPVFYAADKNEELSVLEYLVNECGGDLMIADNDSRLPGAWRRKQSICNFLALHQGKNEPD